MDWIAISVVLVFTFGLYGFGAMAAASVAFVFLPDMARVNRSMASAIIGPALIIAPTLVLFILDVSAPPITFEDVLIASAMLIGPMIVVGFPSAYFLSRGLDRRAAPKLDVFQ